MGVIVKTKLVDVTLRVAFGLEVLIGFGGMTRTVGVGGLVGVDRFRLANSLQADRNRHRVSITKTAAQLLFISISSTRDVLIVPA